MFELLSLVNIVVFLRFCYVCLKRNIGEIKEYTVLVVVVTASEIAMYAFKDNLSNLFSFKSWETILGWVWDLIDGLGSAVGGLSTLSLDHGIYLCLG